MAPKEPCIKQEISVFTVSQLFAHGSFGRARRAGGHVLHDCGAPPSGQALRVLEHNARPKGFWLSARCASGMAPSHLALRCSLSNLAGDHLLARVTGECRAVEVPNSGFNEKSIVVK